MSFVDGDPTLTTNNTSDLEPDDITFEQMYAMYRDQLVRVAERRGSSDAEAAVQETFIKAFNHFDDYEDVGKTRRAWLYRILENTIKDEWRKASRRPATLVEPDSFVFDNRPDSTATDGFHAIEHEQEMEHAKNALKRSLANKNPHFYNVLVRHALYGDSHIDISRDTGTPSSTVRTREFRAARWVANDPEFRKAMGRE